MTMPFFSIAIGQSRFGGFAAAVRALAEAVRRNGANRSRRSIPRGCL